MVSIYMYIYIYDILYIYQIYPTILQDSAWAPRSAKPWELHPPRIPGSPRKTRWDNNRRLGSNQPPYAKIYQNMPRLGSNQPKYANICQNQSTLMKSDEDFWANSNKKNVAQLWHLLNQSKWAITSTALLNSRKVLESHIYHSESSENLS